MNSQKVSLEINGNIGINSKSVSDRYISLLFFRSKYVADNILRQQCTYQTGKVPTVSVRMG